MKAEVIAAHDQWVALSRQTHRAGVELQKVYWLGQTDGWTEQLRMRLHDARSFQMRCRADEMSAYHKYVILCDAEREAEQIA